MGWTPGVSIIVWTQCALKINYELFNAGLYSTWEYRRRLPCMNFELYILLCIYMQASSPCRLVTFLLVHSYLLVVHLYSQLQTLICTLIYIILHCYNYYIIVFYYNYNSISFVCQRGRTAVDHALLGGNEEIVQALITASTACSKNKLNWSMYTFGLIHCSIVWWIITLYLQFLSIIIYSNVTPDPCINYTVILYRLITSVYYIIILYIIEVSILAATNRINMARRMVHIISYV